MLFSFCACASGAEKTVLFSYEGTDFYSGTFSYMLSSEKAYYEQQFAYINYYYSGANLGWSSVLDEETGMTYADAVWESLVLNAKRMVIVNHLLKQYNLKLTDESAVSTIEGYIEQDMEDYGDGNEYGLNLFYADYGVDIDMVRDYYLNNASLSVLRDYLYGDNGIQKIDLSHCHFPSSLRNFCPPLRAAPIRYGYYTKKERICQPLSFGPPA